MLIILHDVFEGTVDGVLTDYVAESAARLDEAIAPVAEALKLPAGAPSETGIRRLVRLRELLLDRPIPPAELLVAIERSLDAGLTGVSSPDRARVAASWSSAPR